jgi:hypothetical protein
MFKFFLTIVLCLISGVAFAAPANSNGNKSVGYWEGNWPVYCDGDEVIDLWAEFSGWSQYREFKGNHNRNISLEIFHLETIYTHIDSGDTWVWKDRGPDHYFFVTNDDGEPEEHWSITGRSAFNVIGHVVFNTETWELVLAAGQHPFGGDDDNFMAFSPDNLACDVLY